MRKMKPKEKMKELNKNEIEARINEKIAELEQKNAEYLAGWQRCKADFENYKNRQESWAEEFRKYSNEELVIQIIPVLDNLILALNHIPETEESKNWRLGVDQIIKQMEGILVNNSVAFIDVSLGDVFNPQEHESIDHAPKEEEPSSTNRKSKLTVKKVLKRGYRMGEKIVQPALVVIG